MSFQAYMDAVKAKTGKGPAEFAALAAEKGLSKHGEVVAWLKADFALGHGHATAIAAAVLKPDAFTAPAEDKLTALFSGKKAGWRAAAERVVAHLQALGGETGVNETYINLLRGKKKVGIVQPSSGDRLDVGLKLKGTEPTGRLEAARSWNTMVTHRVKVTDEAQVDDELLAWVKAAFDAAQ